MRPFRRRHSILSLPRSPSRQDMSTSAIAQLLSNTLYYKRFFPYYTFNVLAGLDENGAGAVYGYDAIGSFERIPYGVTGSGSALITSILDNQVSESGTKTRESRMMRLALTSLHCCCVFLFRLRSRLIFRTSASCRSRSASIL